MPCACKINGMGKKKNKVSGTNGDLSNGIILGLAVPVGIVSAHEIKSYVTPMLFSDTATDDEKKSMAMYVNIGVVAVGALGIYGSGMLEKGVAREGVKGVSIGMAGQALYSLYVNYIRPLATDGTANNRIQGSNKGWDAMAWSNAKRKALGVYGADNAAPGVMGADNASPGVMGVDLRNPLLTQVDQIGNYNRVGTCGI